MSIMLLLPLAVLGIVMAIVLRWRHRRRWPTALGMAGLVVVVAMFGLLTSASGLIRTASQNSGVPIPATVLVGALAFASAWIVMLRGH